MSLVGKLQDLSAIDILQIISISKRTGILTVQTSEGKNNFVFKNGMILSAASASLKTKNLGQILIERGLITVNELEHMLDLQKERGNQHLGSILLEAGAVHEDILREIIKERIRQSILNLVNTKEGSFSFHATEVIPFDDIAYDPVDAQGWVPQNLLKDFEPEERKPGKAIPFQPSNLKIRKPPKNEGIITYAEIKTKEGELPRLPDLQLSDPPDVPDIAFDLIAEQIDFPVATPATPAPALVPILAPEVEQSKSAGTILLVEDEALIRQLIASRLIDEGFELFQADNPKEGLRMVRQLMAKQISFSIITDLVMATSTSAGFLGGLEFVEAVRKINKVSPILVMTDYEDVRAQSRAYTLGVFDFHKKPILSRSSVEETRAKIFRFTDALLETLRQPPYQLQEKEADQQFWGDLKIATNEESSRSASNMVEQLRILQAAIRNHPRETPDISSLILRYSAEFFERGLLFQLKKEEAIGISGFGETGEIESMPQKARRIKIPISEESIFSKVAKQKLPHIGKLADTPLNRQFISVIGRLIPPSVAMLPFLAGETVIGMFYGDNAVSRKPIKDLEALEILLAQAGLAIEETAPPGRLRIIKFK